MASGDEALKRSWAKDISMLLEKKILSLFTCANDHNDLKCALWERGTRDITVRQSKPSRIVSLIHFYFTIQAPISLSHIIYIHIINLSSMIIMTLFVYLF